MALGENLGVRAGRVFAPVGLVVLVVSTSLLLECRPASAAEYKVPTHHPNIEEIARDVAYRGGNTAGGAAMSVDPELREELEQRGLRYREGIDDSGSTGMQAMVLEDKKTGQTFIAFRGTWPKGREGGADVLADADAAGDTGSSQYNAHRERLAKWAEKYPNAIVTGHSLGAALGQRYISEHPGAVREGVLFNAPAIAPEHGHRFARAEKQPPVTIYVGKTNVADDTSAPDYDFVSELGGRNHLPGKIVEVTHTEPHSGFANVLMTSHTGTMLSGNSARKIEEISFEDYERRREDSWRDAEPLISSGRWGLLVADSILQSGAFEGLALSAVRTFGGSTTDTVAGYGSAIANMLHGFGKDGPTPPTPAMVESGARDCVAAGGYVDRARRAIQGRITSLKISNAKTHLLFARDRSVGCPDVRARMASVEGVIRAAAETLSARREQNDALRDRIQAAVAACDIDALPSLKSEASNTASGALDSEIALLEAAKTAVSQYNNGKAAFNSGNYAAAKPALQRALSSFGKLPSGACQIYAARAQRRLGTIEEKDRADAEDIFCDVMGAKIDAASANFMQNRLAAARLTLRELDNELTPSSRERCPGVDARVRRGLDQIDRLELEDGRVAQAEKACDVGKLEQLADRYSGKNHPWFKDALTRARGAIEDCQREPPTEEEAVADCRRQAVDIGKVYGTTKFEPDGSYTCHTCEKGQVSTGVACVTDVASAEADCRQQTAAEGKVYAKTVVHNDGQYDCHWCEPGQIFANDQCGTVAAHNETACRRTAASKGKVYAKTVSHKNGKYDCHWCDRGQIFVKGRCGTVAAHNEAACRQTVAKKRKVYGRTVTHKNGTYDCQWCERGQYYAKGRCHSRQRAQPRAQRQPRAAPRAPSWSVPCHPGTTGHGC